MLPAIRVLWIEAKFMRHPLKELSSIRWIGPIPFRFHFFNLFSPKWQDCIKSVLGKGERVTRVAGLPEAGRALVVGSLKLRTTSSQLISSRTRYIVDCLGLPLPAKNPLCLKLTIWPGRGSHRFTNSEVPGTAINETPFGLVREEAIRR